MQPSKRAQLAIFFTVFVDLLGFGIVIPMLPSTPRPRPAPLPLDGLGERGPGSFRPRRLLGRGGHDQLHPVPVRRRALPGPALGPGRAPPGALGVPGGRLRLLPGHGHHRPLRMGAGGPGAGRASPAATSPWPRRPWPTPPRPGSAPRPWACSARPSGWASCSARPWRASCRAPWPARRCWPAHGWYLPFFVASGLSLFAVHAGGGLAARDPHPRGPHPRPPGRRAAATPWCGP